MIEFLTSREVATLLGVSLRQVSNLRREGHVVAVADGVYDRASVLRVRNARSPQTARLD